MDWLRENALVRGSCLWRSTDGEPWIVSFDFAEVGGRLECVGMQMRSYIEVEQHDEFGPYRACLSGEVSIEDLLPMPQPLAELDLRDPQSRADYLRALGEPGTTPLFAALKDPDCVAAILDDPERRWAPETSPRPLRTSTMRELPLGALLVHVRRQIAAIWRSGVMAPRTAAPLAEPEYPEDAQDSPSAPLANHQTPGTERERLDRRTWELLQSVKRNCGWDDELIRERDELSRMFAEFDAMNSGPDTIRVPHPTLSSVPIDAAEFRRLTQQAAGSFHVPGQKAGRPAKYSPAQLEVVAKTYREAFAGGSPSPTKDVADKLGLSRSQAAKLVMRCRDPRVALLGPTKPRQAGGLAPSPSGQSTPGEGTEGQL
jgi:hypothetical protein